MNLKLFRNLKKMYKMYCEDVENPISFREYVKHYINWRKKIQN